MLSACNSRTEFYIRLVTLLIYSKLRVTRTAGHQKKYARYTIFYGISSKMIFFNEERKGKSGRVVRLMR